MAKRLKLKDINEVQDRRDKYLEAMHPDIERKLAPHEMERLELMNKYRHWRLGGLSPEGCRQRIMQEGKMSYSAACAIVEDSNWLYGKLEPLSKIVENSLLYQMCYNSLKDIDDDKESSGVEKSNARDRVIDRMAKLVGAYDLSESMNPEVLMPATNYNIVVVNSKQ